MMDILLGHLYKDRRQHPTRREVVGRLSLSLASLVIAGTSFTARATYVHMMVYLGGELALAFVMLLGALGTTLLIDTLANELLPHRRRLHALTSMRQYLWMANGLLHNLFAFLVLTSDLSVSLGGLLIVFGWCSFLLAFVDAAQEKTDQRCAP
jgi:hypothetical protein